MSIKSKQISFAVALAFLASTAHAGMFDGFVNKQVIDTSAIVAAREEALTNYYDVELDTSPQAKKCAQKMAATVDDLRDIAQAVSGYSLSNVTTETDGITTADWSDIKPNLTKVVDDKITFSFCPSDAKERAHAATNALALVIARREHTDPADGYPRVYFWQHQIDVARDVVAELESVVDEAVKAECGK